MMYVGYKNLFNFQQCLFEIVLCIQKRDLLNTKEKALLRSFIHFKMFLIASTGYLSMAINKCGPKLK